MPQFLLQECECLCINNFGFGSLNCRLYCTKCESIATKHLYYHWMAACNKFVCETVFTSHLKFLQQCMFNDFFFNDLELERVPLICLFFLHSLTQMPVRSGICSVGSILDLLSQILLIGLSCHEHELHPFFFFSFFFGKELLPILCPCAVRLLKFKVLSNCNFFLLYMTLLWRTHNGRCWNQLP